MLHQELCRPHLDRYCTVLWVCACQHSAIAGHFMIMASVSSFVSVLAALPGVMLLLADCRPKIESGPAGALTQYLVQHQSASNPLGEQPDFSVC